jgi:hypothetical protein
MIMSRILLWQAALGERAVQSAGKLRKSGFGIPPKKYDILITKDY